MSPDELRQAAVKIWGKRGWVTALSSALGVDRTQVWRWLNGKLDVPGPVSAAVSCWLAAFDRGETLPSDRPK